ncbi:MAG: FkbM family methyltransferase [Bacteroidia bacterium]
MKGVFYFYTLMPIKQLIRKTLLALRLDISKNLKYDRLTEKVLRKVLTLNSNCIDVGCHKGEILEQIIKLSPKGKHFAFEPIPVFYNNLKEKFSSKANIYPYALAEKEGVSTFLYVRNAPAYSGLKQRKYQVKPDIEEISVEVKMLDEVIPKNTAINLIKIDVEGGELDVLKGAKGILETHKPTIIFECGLGASDYYHTKPEEVFSLLQSVALNIFTLNSFLAKKMPLTEEEFVHLFNAGKEYYFVASK